MTTTQFARATRKERAEAIRTERYQRLQFLTEIENGTRTAMFCSRREMRWLRYRGKRALFYY